jgi:hypothetical protein
MKGCCSPLAPNPFLNVLHVYTGLQVESRGRMGKDYKNIDKAHDFGSNGGLIPQKVCSMYRGRQA